VGAVLDMLATQFLILTLQQHAQYVAQDVTLPLIVPRVQPLLE